MPHDERRCSSHSPPLVGIAGMRNPRASIWDHCPRRPSHCPARLHLRVRGVCHSRWDHYHCRIVAGTEFLTCLVGAVARRHHRDYLWHPGPGMACKDGAGAALPGSYLGADKGRPRDQFGLCGSQVCETAMGHGAGRSALPHLRFDSDHSSWSRATEHSVVDWGLRHRVRGGLDHLCLPGSITGVGSCSPNGRTPLMLICAI